MLGNDLVLLSRSMTFPNHSTEKMCAIGSFVRWNQRSDDIAVRETTFSEKDMRTVLSERPVRGTIACVCLVNETQKTLEVNKMDGFSKYHSFIFELNGIRVWRADGVGKGIVIPYQLRHDRKAPRSWTNRSCCRCTLSFSQGGSNP